VIGHPGDDIERTRSSLLAEGAILCIRLGEGGRVVEACRAAARGGLRVLELTLTTPGALEAMEALARDPDLLVGGGTVLAPAEVATVAAAGGRFVLSPVFDPEVVDEAHARGLLAVPGAATAAEILAAWRHGARLVKLFPSGPLGGPAYLRAVRGPLPDVPLVPTSGPTAETLADYLAAGAVAVGVGAEVFPPGWTPASVEAAARRVHQALAAARAR
jgi:2-dehydro-3-deoxyphosphogluconate aldolase/(4S)-4-hydroxy-2-oxoglutarate aldolase